MHKFSFLLFALPIFLSSCEDVERVSSSYYPVDSLVKAQVLQLLAEKAVLSKKAEIDGSEEASTFTPKDSAAWANELDIFAELNVINNGGNAGNYVVEKGLKDSSSNLLINSFKSNEVLPIVYLKVFYLDTPSQLRRIEALYQEENQLVKGSRLLILEFQEIKNKILLTSYTIEGSQKMFLRESVKFSIRGTIKLP